MARVSGAYTPTTREVLAMGKTPPHSIRIPHDRWHAAKALARSRGTNLTAVINDYLERYIADAPEPKGSSS